MKSNRLLLGLLAGFLVATYTGPSLATEKTLQVIMPWSGDGTIHSISTHRLLFMGEFEGIMYAENAEGELDAAFASCPATQYIDTASKKTEAKGYCNIAITGEDTVFAEWTCEGKVGACKGSFILTGGTGKFEGVTGSSEFTVRSVLSTVVAGMSSGSVVRAASGLAILPKLTYTLPSGN
ncbi:MAG: hypothetical protein JSU75_08950 [Gammaproteobacteria bacterium]|nr:MAG: hypothetical protein JSU75_08950 [Gammaproteobacteria bacterium]